MAATQMKLVAGSHPMVGFPAGRIAQVSVYIQPQGSRRLVSAVPGDRDVMPLIDITSGVKRMRDHGALWIGAKPQLACLIDPAFPCILIGRVIEDGLEVVPIAGVVPHADTARWRQFAMDRDGAVLGLKVETLSPDGTLKSRRSADEGRHAMLRRTVFEITI